MIYWFTGQPGSGKTVLADLFKEKKLPHAFRIDGDEMRELFANKDYSEKVQKWERKFYTNYDENVFISLLQ